MKYTNPILPGFHPDPSVCRIDDDYFLVTSSFEYYPGVPIFHSKDLVHWRQIGNCLDRPNQLSLGDSGGRDGIYAPTIRFHKGQLYLVTTNVGHGGNFYVTAADPAGPWSDPVWIDTVRFDPSFLFDDDGTVYYTRRGNSGIDQARIDTSSGALLETPREIAHGLCSVDIEGPHLYKIDNWYYLLAAEGGTRAGHMATIRRSVSPWGPFEPCPHNPILTNRHRPGNHLRDIGHAELVEAHDGSWWLFCLGTRQHTCDPATPLGRETFLMPVSWRDGWPVVHNDGVVTPTVDAPHGPAAHSWPAEPNRDEFNDRSLAPCWVTLRRPPAAVMSLSERPGWLRLHGDAAALNDIASPAFIARRQTAFAFCAETLLDFNPATDNEEAGLCVFMTNRFHYALCITRRDGAVTALLRKRVGDIDTVTAVASLHDDKPVRLVIKGSADTYAFSVVTENGALHELGGAMTRLISMELASVWTGAVIGMYATGNGRECTAPADFDWFIYQTEKSDSR